MGEDVIALLVGKLAADVMASRVKFRLKHPNKEIYEAYEKGQDDTVAMFTEFLNTVMEAVGEPDVSIKLPEGFKN